MEKEKQKINYWKWSFIGFIAFLIALAFFYSSPSSEDVDRIWSQHRSTLENDRIQTSNILDQYCYDGLPYAQLSSCVNIIYPRLEAYAQHIVNARIFLNDNGEVYSNQQELFGWLDEQAVVVKTIANNVDTMIQEYNNWVLSQQQIQEQEKITQEILVDVLKILALIV